MNSDGVIAGDSAPVFLVGSGRSGTALLGRMLSAHPRIFICHELTVYGWDGIFPQDRSGDAFLDYYQQTTHFRWTRLVTERLWEALPKPFLRSQVGLFYREVMRQRAAQFGRTRYGDQTPSLLGVLPRLFADFPDAQVICVVRDPRSTVMSMRRMPWLPASVLFNALAYEHSRRNQQRFAGRMLTVRLEDLLSDTRKVMQRVLDFVREPWDDAVLDHTTYYPDPSDEPPFPWQRQSAQARGPARSEWQSIPPAQVRAIEAICRRSMETYGFARAALSREPAAWRVWWPLLRELPEGLRGAWLLARFLLHMRYSAHPEDDAALRLFRRINPGSWVQWPDFRLPVPPPPLVEDGTEVKDRSA